MRKRDNWSVSLKVCRESIRKWNGNGRILAVAFLVFLFAWIRIEPLRRACETYGLGISCWYFPFQIHDIHTIFYYFGLLLLFCDAPFVDNQQMDVILRSGKKNWFRGKIFYIVATSCLYFLFVAIAGLIEFIPYAGFSFYWEDMMNILSLDSTLGAVIRRNVIMSYSPIEACITQYIICVLLAVLLGLVVFYFNLYKNKVIGMGIAMTVTLTGTLVYFVDLKVSRIIIYFLPMAWSTIDVFKQEVGGVPFVYAVMVLLVADMLFAFLIMQKSKTYNIECQEEM